MNGRQQDQTDQSPAGVEPEDEERPWMKQVKKGRRNGEQSKRMALCLIENN